MKLMFPGIAGWALVAMATALTGTGEPPSTRIGYLTAHEAIITLEGADTTTVAASGDGIRVESLPRDAAGPQHFRITGLQPGQTTVLRLTTPGADASPTILQVTPPKPASDPIRIQLTGTIPSETDPSDLDLVAAGLQIKETTASIAIGGLFSWEKAENLTTAGYLRTILARAESSSGRIARRL